MLSNITKWDRNPTLRARLLLGVLILSVLLSSAMLVSVSVGPVPISLANVLSVLLSIGPIETTLPVSYTHLTLPTIYSV